MTNADEMLAAAAARTEELAAPDLSSKPRRKVAVLACMPQTAVLYETVPLFLVPRSFAETALLVVLSYAQFYFVAATPVRELPAALNGGPLGSRPNPKNPTRLLSYRKRRPPAVSVNLGVKS